MAKNAIRCLSVHQPYAWAICTGIKRTENRTWAVDYRGLVAIHASASKTQVNSLLKRGGKGIVSAETFPTGAIIGAAILTDVLPLSPELETDPFAAGPACFLFDSPKLFADAIPFKGKLNLFNLSDELSDTVTKCYQAAVALALGDVHTKLASLIRADEFDLITFRAQSYAQLQQWENAARCCTNAIQLNPKLGMPLRMRAFSHGQLQRYDEGLADVNAALALTPDDAAAFWVRSEIFRLMGNMQDAAADYRRAIELDPKLQDPRDPSYDDPAEEAKGMSE